ncbi:hypothetical protein scyTo_0004313, partial [Scyliorhinus torazame]|nr:hypothetical protein [Scyliorhinus torazame]
ESKDFHFNVNDLESVAFEFCDTLLDYCDPDKSKYIQCKRQLQNQIKEDVAAKLKMSSVRYDSDASLGDILSYIESSTTGSNSSESDYQPVHLGREVHENVIKKKKQLKTKKQRQNSYLIRKVMDTAKHYQPTAASSHVEAATIRTRLQPHDPFEEQKQEEEQPIILLITKDYQNSDSIFSGQVHKKHLNASKYEFEWVPKKQTENVKTSNLKPQSSASAAPFYPIRKTKLPIIDHLQNRDLRTARRVLSMRVVFLYNDPTPVAALLLVDGCSGGQDCKWPCRMLLSNSGLRSQL